MDKTTKLRCQTCGRVASTNLPEEEWGKADCSECGYVSFVIKDSEDGIVK